VPLMMRTSNPAFGGEPFRPQYGGAIDVTERMTLRGTVNKTGILLLCAIGTATWTWYQFMQTHEVASIALWMMLGLFGGLILSFATIFKRTWSPVTAPLYALCQGLFLGGISAVFELRYPGIAFQAVCLTFGTLLAMLLAYSTGLIKATRKFQIGVMAATGGIALFYLFQMVMSFFHVQFLTINGAGPIGIAFSVFVVAIAALNLVLDFALIEQGVNSGAPKYMEWYGGFAIMVTLVWLYLEILRLLAKLNQRR
jgi:uncharacterized YccA/Bax inhibitor family protein